MAVYVDALRKTSRSHDWPWSHHCHMMADTLDELHDMALRISLRRDYFQRDHYDLVSSRRKLAVAAGAVEVSSRMLVLLRQQHVATLKERGE